MMERTFRGAKKALAMVLVMALVFGINFGLGMGLGNSEVYATGGDPEFAITEEGDSTPLQVRTVANGYTYNDYYTGDGQVNLYVVTLPYGVTRVAITVPQERIIYNYANKMTWLAGDYPNSGKTGITNATFEVDVNKDGKLDYLQVQTPYDSSWQTNYLYGIHFEYTEFNASVDGTNLVVGEPVTEGYSTVGPDYVSTVNITSHAVYVPTEGGITSIKYTFPENRLAYNYKETGTYLYGAIEDPYTGVTEVTLPIDANADGFLDCIQVQMPYTDNGTPDNWYDDVSENLYGIKLVYADGTNVTNAFATHAGTYTYKQLLNNTASSYASAGAAGDSECMWIAADMAAYADLAQGTTSKFTTEQKQAIVDKAIETLENPGNPGNAAKSVLALTALGYDATQLGGSKTTFSGIDVLDSLAFTGSNVSTAGSNVYTLPYEIMAYYQFGTTYQGKIDKLISSAVSQAFSSGGWGYEYDGVTYVDADAITPMLMALAPYYNKSGYSNVTTAINKAKTAIRVNVELDGNGAVYSPWTESANAASTGLLTAGLVAIGEDPETFFEGKSLRSGLESVANADGTYLGGNANDYEQGFRGLIALARYERDGGAYNLYDFNGNSWSRTPVAATQWASHNVVKFNLQPADLTLTVSVSGGGVCTPHNSIYYDLTAGDYVYTASKDGYTTKSNVPFAVADSAAQNLINVSLVKASTGGGSSDTITISVKIMEHNPSSDCTAGKGTITYKNNSAAYHVAASGTVTLSKGDTARDALIEVLDDNNISYNEQSNGYFNMIDGLDEFDHGPNSGWMYMVGGSSPNVNASDYTFNRSANMVWFYTDDYTQEKGSESFHGSGKTDTSIVQETPVEVVSIVVSANPEIKVKASETFKDVNSGSWFEKSVDFALNSGLMQGTGDGNFEPSGTLSGAQVGAVLGRMVGEDMTSSWNKAVDKYGKADISREATAQMLYSFAKEHGLVSANFKATGIASETLAAFSDAATIDSANIDAMNWAISVGLFKGVGENKLDNKGQLTRAQFATLLERFVNLAGKAE